MSWMKQSSFFSFIIWISIKIMVKCTTHEKWSFWVGKSPSIFGRLITLIHSHFDRHRLIAVAEVLLRGIAEDGEPTNTGSEWFRANATNQIRWNQEKIRYNQMKTRWEPRKKPCGSHLTNSFFCRLKHCSWLPCLGAHDVGYSAARMPLERLWSLQRQRGRDTTIVVVVDIQLLIRKMNRVASNRPLFSMANLYFQIIHWYQLEILTLFGKKTLAYHLLNPILVIFGTCLNTFLRQCCRCRLCWD